MDGKNALVTGSTSGIGNAIATALAGQGANVVLHGLDDPAAAESGRADFERKYGVRARYCQADLSSCTEIEAMVERATEELGPIDILFNNAGIEHVCPIEEFPVDRWEAILSVNLSAAFHTTRLLLGGMKSRRWGRIVNIASAAGLVGVPHKSAYVSAKHGLVGLTKTTALEAAQFGVTVNAVCPGYVRTPMVDNQIPKIAQERGLAEQTVVTDVLLASQPTREFVTKEQLGSVAVFLCSDAAASITGIALPVDGAWTAQ